MLTIYKCYLNLIKKSISCKNSIILSSLIDLKSSCKFYTMHTFANADLNFNLIAVYSKKF